MATAATDWVTVDQMKVELRIASSETEHNTLIEDEIKYAVAYVEQYIGLPLLEKDVTIKTRPAICDNAPVYLSGYPVVEVKSGKADAGMFDAPIALTTSQLTGGTLVEIGPYEFMLYPDSAPWDNWDKVRLSHDAKWYITCKVKLNETQAINDGIKQAIRLLVVKFYDGDRAGIAEGSAVASLLAPYCRIAGSVAL